MIGIILLQHDHALVALFAITLAPIHALAHVADACREAVASALLKPRWAANFANCCAPAKLHHAPFVSNVAAMGRGGAPATTLQGTGCPHMQSYAVEALTAMRRQRHETTPWPPCPWRRPRSLKTSPRRVYPCPSSHNASGGRRTSPRGGFLSHHTDRHVPAKAKLVIGALYEGFLLRAIVQRRGHGAEAPTNCRRATRRMPNAKRRVRRCYP